jgi:hypothetical protein
MPVVLVACLGLAALTGLGESAGAQSLTHRWSQYYGSTDHQMGRAVATDPDGNVIIAGEFMTWINFGGGAMLSAGGYDIFLAKFDSDGHHIWSKQFGDASSQYVSGLAVTSSGDILLCGSFQGTVNFGGTTHTSAGDEDAYVAKFTPGGALIWSGGFGDASEQACRAVAAGSGNMTYLIGYFAGTIDLGGGPLTSAGDNDIWLAALDGSNGGHIWSKRFGDASPQVGWGLDAAPNGVVITGLAQGSVDFGGGSLTSAGSYDLFLAKFSSAGVHQWSHLYGDASSQNGVAVRVNDLTGEVRLVGQFSGTIDLGGGPLVSTGLNDICLARLTATGAHVWSRRFGGTQSTYPRGIDVTPEGIIAMTGFFDGTSDLGGGPLTSAGNMDIFIATYDDDGNHVTSQRFGDADNQVAQGIAFDPDGDLVDVGSFMGTVNFGGNPLTSYGLYDAYLVKFGGLAAVPETPDDLVLGPGSGPALDPNPFALRIAPNPVAAGAMLNYTLPEAGRVRVRVLDAEGRCLYTLADEWQDAGERTLPWGLGAQAGASAGRVRFVQVDAGGRSAALRVIGVE